MLDPLFEQSYILLKLPKSLLKLQSLIEQKARERRIQVITITEGMAQEDLVFPASIKGIFVYNDNEFDTGILLTSLARYIPRIFLLSETALKYPSSSFVVYSPKYKKIGEVIDEYLDTIASHRLDFTVDHANGGFKYTTYGDIRVNPYPGLFLGFDYPNVSREYDWGGTELTERVVSFLKENHVDFFYEFEPTNEMFGGIGKSALRGNAELLPDTLQLLLTIDRIEHTKRIYKALKSGKVVVESRYAFSSLAFSYGDFETGFLLAANSRMYWPDLYFVLHYNSSNLAVSRMHRDIPDREKLDYDEKQIQVNEALDILTGMFKGITFELEGRKSIDTLTKQVLRAIKNHPKFKYQIEVND